MGVWDDGSRACLDRCGVLLLVLVMASSSGSLPSMECGRSLPVLQRWFSGACARTCIVSTRSDVGPRLIA